MEHADALTAALTGDRTALTAVLDALGHEVRLRVFEALAEPQTVPELRVALEITNPERHIEVLQRAGLVSVEGGISPKRWRRNDAAFDQFVDYLGTIAGLRTSGVNDSHT